MDIVRIKLCGSGFDVVRGVISKQEYNKLKNSLDNVWVKNLNSKLRKKLRDFAEDFHDYGISKGDITITVNDEELISIPTNVLNDYSFNDVELVDIEGYQYPITEGVIITSVQSLEGIFMDVMFLTENFDINKLKFIQKVIQDRDENIIIDSLISEVYYDHNQIIFTGNNTDLRMSRIYYDIGGDDKKVLKNEKDNN